MRPPLGAWAPKVTQHVASGSTSDRYGNKVASFTSTTRSVFAEFPGNSLETDSSASDVVTADVVLLVPAELAVADTDEWTCSDGLRYRVNGRPARYRHPHTGTAITQVNLRRIS